MPRYPAIIDRHIKHIRKCGIIVSSDPAQKTVGRNQSTLLSAHCYEKKTKIPLPNIIPPAWHPSFRGSDAESSDLLEHAKQFRYRADFRESFSGHASEYKRVPRLHRSYQVTGTESTESKPDRSYRSTVPCLPSS